MVYSLLQKGKSVSHSVVSDSLQLHGLFVAHQDPLSLGFSIQEYWRGLPVPSPGDLPDPWIKPESPALQADSLLSEPPGKPLFSLTSFIFRIKMVAFNFKYTLQAVESPLNHAVWNCQQIDF